MIYNDKEAVWAVQEKLKAKGYTDISEVDGKLGETTKDVILAFRRRNQLPLVDYIDTDFIRVLDQAPDKVVPLRVQNATPEHLESRVAAVATTVAAKKASWWSQFWAWFITIPSGVFTLLILVFQNLESAVNMVRPAKEFLSDVPLLFWGVSIFVVALALAIQSRRTSQLTEETEDRLVEGYREGTVKNDKDVVYTPPV